MKQCTRFSVGAGEAGERLDVFLAARLFSLSRMRIAELLARGACSVDGEAAHAGFKLSRGQAVELTLDEEAPGAMTPEDLPLEIVFEDEHLLVVSKPAGMLVHPTRGVKTGTLANALTFHLNRMRIAEAGLRIADCGLRIEEEQTAPQEGQHDASPQPERLEPESLNPQSAIHNPQSFVRPGIVHRLDRATSGLMVVAKTQRALSLLSQHFHRRLVEKRYLAVVHRVVGVGELTIRAPIGKDPLAHPKWSVLEGGKSAETRLRVLERRGGLTLVELEPVTGRTNQLRIHCAHAGHPIVGDEWYAGDGFPRLCLHAAGLSFHHPARSERMEFDSPLPSSIAGAFRDGLAGAQKPDGEG